MYRSRCKVTGHLHDVVVAMTYELLSLHFREYCILTDQLNIRCRSCRNNEVVHHEQRLIPSPLNSVTPVIFRSCLTCRLTILFLN
jgi:hypothetical protein